MRKDLIYAIRNIARNPGMSAVAILTLALGIGANTAMFSVIHAVLLRPLPLEDPDRLVTIWARIPRMNIPLAFVEYNTFVEWWRARSRSFEAMSAYSPGSAVLTSGDQPQRIRMMRVSANHFPVIGTRPAVGRDFLAEEDRPGAPRVAIISDGLWKRRFGGDRAILGRPIVLDNNSYTVIGILAPGFDFHQDDVFTPIAHSGARERGMPSVGTYARLKRGVALATAQAEIDGLCRGWVEQYRYPKDWGAGVWPIRDFMVRGVRTSVLVLAVAVALVLLIACANVANLLLARAGARQREIAVRTALGAGRYRIVRQLLTESALLGAIAAGVGLLLAWGSVRALLAAELPLPYPALRKLSLDLPVLGFTVVATLATTLLFGLAPALSAAQTRLVENLKEGGRGAGEGLRRSHLRSSLVVAEVALALLLVIGATLTVRSLSRLMAVDPGFNPEGVLTAHVTLPQSSYPEPPRRVNFFKAVLERVAATPGVQAAAMVSHLPFSGSKSGNDIIPEGVPLPPDQRIIAFTRAVDPEYFRTMQIRLLRGRSFTPRDPEGSPVAIINETLAKRCWPGQDPIGKRFGFQRSEVRVTVVGLIADIRNTSLADDPDAEYFVPFPQSPGASMALVARTRLEPARLVSAIRNAVSELDKNLPVSDVAVLAESVFGSTRTQRFSVTLLGIFALIALLLAAVGIYGVVSYSVTRQTREIGVRMALGAARGRILGMVVGRAVLLGGAGVVIGIGGSFALTRLLGSMLYGVSATDPAVFAAAAVFLLAVSAMAAFIPARRAARVDPLVALHHE